MRIAEINMLLAGSTGKIMLQIADVARGNGFCVKTYSPIRFLRGKKEELLDIKDHFYWGTRKEAFFHYYVGTLLGRNGMYSKGGTRRLIKDLKQFKPDVIHLHNLHGYCINFAMLFSYIKKYRIKVVWTLHDCWTFTGHCPHFIIAKCNKWKTGCHNCPQPKIYPKMYLDTSKKMYRLKKKWFGGVEDMTVVTPSAWLKNLAAQSFLNNHPIRVINNGIDLAIFKPTESDFREKYGIKKQKILLGVAFDWGYRKGLDVFIELAKTLDEREYQIVLVGTNDEIDKQLPSSIISIHRTNNQRELAEIYTAADLFVNPTREENYPTVNMESLACGTPVLTFNTGGSPEIIDNTCGSVVQVDDLQGLKDEIFRICTSLPYSSDNCLAKATTFDMNERIKEYIKLYGDITHST